MYIKSCFKSSTFKNYESNSNSNICKILHLPFDMLCYFPIMEIIPCEMHWYESLCPIVISVSIIPRFLSFEDNKNKINASNNYKLGVKYQWNQSHQRNIKCLIYHLLCFVPIMSTKSSPCTVYKPPN